MSEQTKTLQMKFTTNAEGVVTPDGRRDRLRTLMEVYGPEVSKGHLSAVEAVKLIYEKETDLSDTEFVHLAMALGGASAVAQHPLSMLAVAIFGIGGTE